MLKLMQKCIIAHFLSFSQTSQITKSVQSEQLLHENHIHIKQVYTPTNLGIADNKIRSLAFGSGVWNPTFGAWLQPQNIKYFDQSL